ncbi:MAG: lipopolysaccharide heptosyltransferase II [Verrucomicrobiota bacterium]
MKILILKPSSLGDVIQALPVLRLLKLHLPHAEVYWWLATDLVPLLENDPDLAGIIPFQRKRWNSSSNWRRIIRSVHEIRAHRFDWVIDLQGLARSGLIAWLANGAFTIGLDDHREGARGFYDVAIPRPSARVHAVDWYLSVAAALGIPVHQNFDWLPRRPTAAASVQSRWNIDGARWFALSPGARWLNKRWPAEYFTDTVRHAAAEFPNAKFAILGGAEDKPLAAAIMQAHPQRCVDLTGQTTLPEMIEWVRCCDLMITNDTGPMHVAAALRKPVVALFGPTSPHFTGPYGQIERVMRVSLPCAPCLKGTCSNPNTIECLRAIAPDAVLKEMRNRLH